ncbi:MAG: hypothetical protein IJ551_09755 [Prevotella sp.]|nr:hypothetical protein [Prevotella sp.]
MTHTIFIIVTYVVCGMLSLYGIFGAYEQFYEDERGEVLLKCKRWQRIGIKFLVFLIWPALVAVLLILALYFFVSEFVKYIIK